MLKIGICVKCGKKRKVLSHHWHGYSEEHKDDVAFYCGKCHRKAHIKARKEGKCTLSKEERIRKSGNSCHRRTRKIKLMYSITLMRNVMIRETVSLNTNTGHPCCSTRFQASKTKKLLFIDV